MGKGIAAPSDTRRDTQRYEGMELEVIAFVAEDCVAASCTEDGTPIMTPDLP